MATTANLIVLQTSDVHTHLLPYDYFRDIEDPTCGLALARDAITEARAQATTLLLDTGDLLQGTPMAELFARRTAREHPAVRALDVLGYDAVTLGNHDLNYGLAFAQAVYGALPCPVVQSNMHHSDGRPVFAETHILRRVVTDQDGTPHTLRIGLFGVLPPQVMDWDGEHLRGQIGVADMVDAATRASAALKAQGADIIIALAHTGLTTRNQAYNSENRAHDIAALPDVDVVLAGHSHKMLPSRDPSPVAGVDARRATIAGTPAMMPGPNASHIARMDLSLTHDDAGWRIARHSARLIPLAGARPCATLVRSLSSAHVRTRAFITERIGQTSVPIDGTGFAMGYDSGQRLMADAKRWRAENHGPSGAPLLVATSPYRIASVPDGLARPAGPINRCDVFTLYPFPNAMSLLRVTGATVKDWLEHAARIFAPQTSGITQPLLDPDMPTYDFDTLHGLHYRIDPCAPAGARIRDLEHDGRPVMPDDLFHLATSSYRAHGGGQFPAAQVLWTDTLPITQIVEQYLGSRHTVAPPPTLGWDLVPRERQTVLLSRGGQSGAHAITLDAQKLLTLAQQFQRPYMESREVGAGERLANPVRSGRKQP